MPENPVRRHAWFAGKVQGVGFRATAARKANRRGLAGWVRNLPNGEVELAVEGSEAGVAAFLGELSSAYAGGISGLRLAEEPPEGILPGFDVRR